MPIDFECPSCRRRYTVPDAAAGRSTRCKVCGAAMQVPKPTAPEPTPEFALVDTGEVPPVDVAPPKPPTPPPIPNPSRPAAVAPEPAYFENVVQAAAVLIGLGIIQFLIVGLISWGIYASPTYGETKRVFDWTGVVASGVLMIVIPLAVAPLSLLVDIARSLRTIARNANPAG
jgi:hypothetical protein